MFEKLVAFLKKLWKNLTASDSFYHADEQAAAFHPPHALEAEAVQEPGLALQIKVEATGFLVLCASCHTQHELAAVCASCGLPLCSDTRNCQVSHLDADLDQSVVLCSQCAPEMPASR